MTIWSPKLNASADPLYLRIASAIERDVDAGLLVAGSRLPTHRELARMLDVTPVTITRAYAEAARRGLVESATGRGTFVRSARRESAIANEIDLATNTIAVPFPAPSHAIVQRAIAALTNAQYGVGSGSERHRAAGAAWIGDVDADDVVVTAGTQHALFCALAATTRPGDTVLAEHVTYHGVKAAAGLLDLRVVPLAQDRYGITPDALERACRGRATKVLYTIPSLQNPTGIVMPAKRRRDLAQIAEKCGVTIIEDDIFGFLLDDPPPAFRTLAPDRTLFVTGLGKSMSPGMRIGYVAPPQSLAGKVQNAVAASALFATPMLAEIAASWIEDGTALRLARRKREEIAVRFNLARRILDRTGTADPRSPHLWIELPRKWNVDAFVEEARRRGVRIAPASAFAIGEAPRAIRICIGTPSTAAELERALRVIASIDEEAQETIV
ncbi:MAG TPA: PLP-dependent aminotransferase family protein [Thermoanaerobaculia bacterium]|nr:PLP-dependent aminotransferase family protein [Thermoanaerobaculia bacterium]